MIDAPRPTTIRADGTPLPPVEWAPHATTVKPGSAAAWVNAHKPQRPRFLRGSQGAIGAEPAVPPLPSRSQGRVAAKRTLDAGGTVGGGFAAAPAARGSGSAEVSAIPPPVAAANRSAPRNVGNFSPAPQKTPDDAKRIHRFGRLRKARPLLKGTAMEHCMLFARDSGAGVQVVEYGGVAGYRGYKHCGYRLCPWCSQVLAQRDAEKAEKFARGWVKRGNAICMVHFTLRHSRDERPQDTWQAQTRALDSTHHGRPWERFKKEFGLLEYFFGNEVTDGGNGCHKHQHRCWEVQMCDELRSRSGRRAFGRWMQRRYEDLYLAALKKHGRDALPGIALQLAISAPTLENAAKAAEYVTKFAKETMQGGLKSGSRGNHTIFELLDIADDPLLTQTERLTAAHRYAELYYALRGKHWTYFSEATSEENSGTDEDPEVPEPDLDEEGVVVLELTARQAAMLASQHQQCYLLELVEQEGPDVARRWLDVFSDPQRWSREFLARFRGG